ncbi:MAG: hypothetical protein PHO08_14760 [Methylococcales bacterium]|nr:hypothetical protein [Methylococcales bacterium]MDD5630872.1 hypothetical protein [Methylococcales bacterium]
MTTPIDCSQNTDPLKLIREGTSQDQRFPDALDPDKPDNPDYPQVDERKTEHAMVFARAYSKYLQFYSPENTVAGNWEAFFSQDVSVQMAVAAVQDVDYYKANIKASFDFLKNHENKNKYYELKNHLGYLFSAIGTLAKQLDQLKEELPTEIALKYTLRNLIQKQLAPALSKLIAYYKAFPYSGPDFANAHLNPSIVLLGATTTAFSDIYCYNFSKDWITNKASDWNTYIASISADGSVYGSSTNVFERINHIATHNLFTSIFDQFLKVFARTVIEAKAELEKTFNGWDNHEPHYALFLSFLRLFDYARAEANTLTQKHLDFYYKEVLKLKEKPAKPSHAHLLIELAKHVDSHEIKEHEFFKAGKDALGNEAFFANDQDFVANRAKVTELKTLYRYKNAPNDTLTFDNDRLFASTKADSADGLGAKLTTADKSWHPFFNKTYKDGKLTKINMPQAEVGFAIASHYLWMAEGKRTTTLDFTVSGTTTTLTTDYKEAIICLVTTEKGWFEKTAVKFITESGGLKLELVLSGGDPAVTSYSQKVHGYNFSTNLPILLVKLRHQDNQEYLYRLVQEMVIEKIDLTVDVKELKSLAVSNDFGPVDTSKPFQPFGAQPVAGNSMIFGSKEIFQKNCQTATLNVAWQNLPTGIFGHEKSATPTITIDSLQDSAWEPQTDKPTFSDSSFSFRNSFEPIFPEQPDFSANEFFIPARGLDLPG